MTGKIKEAFFVNRRQTCSLWVFAILVLVILLAACSPAAPVTTQTTDAPLATQTAWVSATPFALTATLYPTSTPEIPPTLPAPPTARAKNFMGIGRPLKLIHLHMFDEQSGWAIGAGRSFNYIFRTHDGGHSWKDVTPYYGYGSPVFFADGFFALDANTAWATTPQMPACSVQNFSCTIVPNTALIWHTTDGGWTWQGQFVTSLPNNYTPLSIQFLDAQTGWLLSSTITDRDTRYHLHQTTDGGTHWSPIMNVSSRTTPEDPHEKNITAIAFQDPRTAWMSTSEICCEAQVIKEWKIYHSTDGGVTWNPLPLPGPDALPETFLTNPAQCAVQDMQVIQPDVLDAVVYCYVDGGLSKSAFYFHYHSADGGKHWVAFQKTGDVQFVDASLGWRMTPNEGMYDIERTQDGGITWTKLKTVQWNGRLHFVNQWVGWALAAAGNDIALLQTVDGGRTWDQLSPVTTDR